MCPLSALENFKKAGGGKWIVASSLGENADVSKKWKSGVCQGQGLC